MVHHVRDVAGGQRSDDLLHQRRERNQRVVDFVAARLLVSRDHRAEADILLANEALGPPYGHGGGRRLGDERSPKGTGSGGTQRPAQYRTPAQPWHSILPCSPPVWRESLCGPRF